MSTHNPTRSVLVTGASVTGPALAYWLHRAGMDVTVVERSPRLRDTGQNVDVRGAGREVIERMGLLDAVRARNTGEEGIAFVDASDHAAAVIRRETFDGGGFTSELEILRGDLARLLVDTTSDKVRYVFGDSVAATEERDDGILVTFESGATRTFDFVLVAEGMNSKTRKLVLGDAEIRSFHQYTGYFSIARGPSDKSLARWFNAPGGRTIFLRPDNRGGTRVLMSFQERPGDRGDAGYENLGIDAQKALLAERFEDVGWEASRVLSALPNVEDFHFERVGQVRLPRWSRGRVAVVGDAAYCASPISGMGTTLGLVGAYVLAGELARHADHAEAFAAYETLMRPYVEQAQDIPDIAPRMASPHSRLGIAFGRFVLNMATKPVLRTLFAKAFFSKSDSIALPEYR